MMIYKPYDVVAVPFPFVDSNKTKKRPALVVSSQQYFNKLSGHLVLLMITSSLNSPWPLDVELQDLQSCGLNKSSKVRMKTFTLDQKLITKKIGELSGVDKRKVTNAVKKLLSDVL